MIIGSVMCIPPYGLMFGFKGVEFQLVGLAIEIIALILQTQTNF